VSHPEKNKKKGMMIIIFAKLSVDRTFMVLFVFIDENEGEKKTSSFRFNFKFLL